LKEPQELSAEQIEQIKHVFMLFDQNGDETITNNELGIVMRALGQFPTEAEMRAIIAEIDADGTSCYSI
jgi:calmodulin